MDEDCTCGLPVPKFLNNGVLVVQPKRKCPIHLVKKCRRTNDVASAIESVGVRDTDKEQGETHSLAGK